MRAEQLNLVLDHLGGQHNAAFELAVEPAPDRNDRAINVTAVFVLEK